MVLSDERGFWSMVGIILALLIVCLMALGVVKVEFQPQGQDAQTKQALKDTGLKTTTYKSSLDSAKDQINGVNNLLKQQGQAIDQMAQ